jgi:hypothetical protein
MMSVADNEPPAVGDPGKLGRGQRIAALEDFDKTLPEGKRSVRENLFGPQPAISSEPLTHATQIINLSRSAGDFEGLAAGRRIAGVSRHFLGEHAEARSLAEA